MLSRLNKAEHVQVGLARSIHDLYLELEGVPGDSSYAVTHATKCGWLSRDMWDEDTIDQPEEMVENPTLVDEVVVARALAGEDVELTPAELEAVIDRAENQGWSVAEIALVTGLSDRTLQRYRARRRACQRAA